MPAGVWQMRWRHGSARALAVAPDHPQAAVLRQAVAGE